MSETGNFGNTVESLFKGMDSFITTKTVVGEAITLGDTIILPLVDVSFGCAAGANAKNGKEGAGGGLTGKISPSAILVIQNGNTKLVNIKNQDSITKILDLVPDVINKFSDKMGKGGVDLSDEEIKQAVENVTSEKDVK